MFKKENTVRFKRISGTLAVLALMACSETTQLVESKVVYDESELSEAARVLAGQYKEQVLNGKDIAREIGGMASVDQFARWHLIEIMRDENIDPDVKKQVSDFAGKIIDDVDEKNTTMLKTILATTEWQSLAKMRPDVADNAWTIVQHSDDIDFQKETLIKIKPLVLAGTLSGERFANLSDRILKKEGKSQIYGTQTVCENNIYMPYKIQNAENVDKRREAIGLTPLESYINQLREIYGSCSKK